MTFENIRRILLPKEQSRKTTDINQPTILVTNPDDARARRNRLAQLTNNSVPLKKAA